MFHARHRALVLTSIGGVVAAIVGVQLGQSAISEINPVYFLGPVARPQGITPPPEPSPYDPYGREYVWSLPPDPTLAQCLGDCDPAQNRAVRLALDESAGRDRALPYWRDATPTTDLRPWPPGEMPNAGPSLERYMRYPVNREQAERAEAETAQAKASATPAAATPADTLRAPSAMSEPVVEE